MIKKIAALGVPGLVFMVAIELTGLVGAPALTCALAALGPGGMVDGNEVKMEVKAGDKVIAGKYSGTSVKLDGEEYTIVRQSDILAIVE